MGCGNHLTPGNPFASYTIKNESVLLSTSLFFWSRLKSSNLKFWYCNFVIFFWTITSTTFFGVGWYLAQQQSWNVIIAYVGDWTKSCKSARMSGFWIDHLANWVISMSNWLQSIEKNGQELFNTHARFSSNSYLDSWSILVINPRKFLQIGNFQFWLILGCFTNSLYKSTTGYRFLQRKEVLVTLATRVGIKFLSTFPSPPVCCWLA